MDLEQLISRIPTMFYDNAFGIERVIVMTILSYMGLILILRTVGKRSLSKLNIFDFVVTVALGSTLATVLLSKDVAFLEGMMAFVMLCGLQWAVSKLSIRSSRFKHAIRSDPRLLLKDGECIASALRHERVTPSEVQSQIRKSGFGDMEDVAAVVLETDGTFSVIPREQAKTRTALKGVRGVDPES